MNPPNEITPSKPTINPVKQIQSARQIEDCDNGTNDLLVLDPYCFIFHNSYLTLNVDMLHHPQ